MLEFDQPLSESAKPHPGLAPFITSWFSLFPLYTKKGGIYWPDAFVAPMQVIMADLVDVRAMSVRPF
jgi:hypothetical protein